MRQRGNYDSHPGQLCLGNLSVYLKEYFVNIIMELPTTCTKLDKFDILNFLCTLS